MGLSAVILRAAGLAGFGALLSTSQVMAACLSHDVALTPDKLSLDPALGYLVFMRHGKDNSDCKGLAQGFTPALDKACIDTNRRVCSSGEINRMVAFLRGIKDTSGKGAEIAETFSSYACRAMDTAQAIGEFEPVYDINEQRYRSHGHDPNNFIKNLEPESGKLTIIVTHADVIPTVLTGLGLINKDDLSEKNIVNTESFLLEKANDSYRCIARISKR